MLLPLSRGCFWEIYVYLTWFPVCETSCSTLKFPQPPPGCAASQFSFLSVMRAPLRLSLLALWVRSSRTSAYLHGPLSFPSRAFMPHHSGLWKFSGPAFHLVSKFSSLCFLLGSSHHCIFKSADSFPCKEQPTANPSLLCLISDATALLSNAHSVFCVVSESSLKNFWTYGAQLW